VYLSKIRDSKCVIWFLRTPLDSRWLLLSDDVKNSELTGADLVVELCYGKAKSSDYKESGKVIVDRLRSEHLVKREELMKEIGLDAESENDEKKFQRIIRSLINRDEGGFYAVADSRRKNGETYYFLTRGRFDEIQDRIVQNMRNTISTKPREKIPELEEKVQKLERQKKNLRSELQQLRNGS
jgi:hypothetical protein